MAFDFENRNSGFKHFCKICKKGFSCGRALGGHMRAHGIGDENYHLNDDTDPESNWDEKNMGSNVPPINKRMYALRTNPNRLKNCRVCENCGEEFSSWKSFLEHGKCASDENDDDDDDDDDEESLASYPHSDGGGCGWSKRKRKGSFRSNISNYNNTNFSLSEEEDLAICLMMLSNANVDHFDVEPEESCASASKYEERCNTSTFAVPVDKSKGLTSKTLFECKACKKVFTSHQALGGHRASHKKVKGCFAAPLDQIHDDFPITQNDFVSNSIFFDHVGSLKRKSKVHECSICHRIFTSGQALGGHKRCHWITSNLPETTTTSMAKLQQFKNTEIDLKLDLNFPAPTDDRAGTRRGVDLSAEIYLQSGGERKEHQNDNENEKECKNDNEAMQNVDEEYDSQVKLAKLSELKDMQNSSPWLQVGIGSITHP